MYLYIDNIKRMCKERHELCAYEINLSISDKLLRISEVLQQQKTYYYGWFSYCKVILCEQYTTALYINKVCFFYRIVCFKEKSP